MTTFERNELNAKSQGGTEITTTGLQKYLEQHVPNLDKFQIITSRVRNLYEDKIRVLHLHDLALDPESAHLKNEEGRNRFHKLVFSSNWQYQSFRDYLGLPFDSRSTIIETGVDSFEPIWSAKDFSGPIKLIYTSTPHRGLDILVAVFEELVKEYPNIELDVFSSFKIYGWDERDKQYEPLYDRCRNHPKINYRGFSPQPIVRQAVAEAHILAYPNIWPETSCRSLIEAGMAGLLCVHPNHAALPDTAGGMTMMYDFDTDIQAHANNFYRTMKRAIETVDLSQTQDELFFASQYFEKRFSWETIGEKWVDLITQLEETYK